MEIFYKIQINLMTFVILTFLFFIAFRKLDKSDSLNRAFLLTALGVMLGLLAEGISCIFNGYADTISITINNVLSVILFALAPMISFYFFIFIYHLVHPGRNIERSILLLFMIPVFTNVILSILSPFLGLFFSIGSDGIYSRGPLFFLSAFSTYLYMAAGIILVAVNFRRMIRQDFYLILGIGIIPVLGGITQSLFYGILVMWSSAAIALLLGYLFLQDRMIRLDSMTQAWNRESFYFNYSRSIQMTPDKKFGAIFFDVDNLKMINDTYGHLEGDKAIMLVMKIIRSILPQGAVICRLGGDEFIITCDCEKESDIEEMLAKIKKGFQEDQETREKEYPLECSFGSALYTSKYSSLDVFLSHLDVLMYQDKFSKKSKEV